MYSNLSFLWSSIWSRLSSVPSWSQYYLSHFPFLHSPCPSLYFPQSLSFLHRLYYSIDRPPIEERKTFSHDQFQGWNLTDLEYSVVHLQHHLHNLNRLLYSFHSCFFEEYLHLMNDWVKKIQHPHSANDLFENTSWDQALNTLAPLSSNSSLY